MPKTDFVEGRGLRDGMLDPDWSHYLRVYSFRDGDRIVWRAMLKWGTTWGHLAICDGDTAGEAVSAAIDRALAQGCEPAILGF